MGEPSPLRQDAPGGKDRLCLRKPDLWVALPKLGKFQEHGSDNLDCTQGLQGPGFGVHTDVSKPLQCYEFLSVQGSL